MINAHTEAIKVWHQPGSYASSRFPSSEKPPTWVLHPTEHIFCWMHMCPHPLWCWCMGQNINNVYLCFGSWGAQTVHYFEFIWLVEDTFNARFNQQGSSVFIECLWPTIDLVQCLPQAYNNKWYSQAKGTPKGTVIPNNFISVLETINKNIKIYSKHGQNRCICLQVFYYTSGYGRKSPAIT